MDKNSRILITGGQGFVGKFLCNKFREKEYTNLVTFSSSDYDLTNEEQVKKLFEDHKDIDVVVHLAADIGGIMYNKTYPGKSFYNNVMMNTLVQEYSRRNNVKKFVGVGSVCAYPKFVDIPFKEEDLWKGYPEETNASYGISKKMMLVQSQAYRQEFGFNAVHLLMINLYGPEDDFDLENSHVVSALIRKFVEAQEKGDNSVTLWGDGSPSREFLYIDDAAEAIVLAAENYDKPDPVNIGSGLEITIKNLAELIKELVGFEGEIIWDTSKPNGQPRRCLDVSKAKQEFGFSGKTDFKEGLKKTIEWYKANSDKINSNE